MKKKLLDLLEDYKVKADGLLSHQTKALEFLDSALQKLIVKSPRIKLIFDDLKDFIQMVTFWIEGKYEDLPYKSVVLVFGSILYFLNPLDLIPDLVPVFGFTDDAAIIALVLKSVSEDLYKFRIWKQELGLI